MFSASSHRNDPGSTDLEILLEVFALPPVQPPILTDTGENHFIHFYGKVSPLNSSPVDPHADDLTETNGLVDEWHRTHWVPAHS
jgi:hypothetical protein